MLEYLHEIDRELFLFLNGMHNSFFDFVMYWLSDKYIWIPVYLLFVYLLFKFYGKKWWVLLIIAGSIAGISDLISVHAFKNVFERLRPTHAEELKGIVHTVKGYTGAKFGFLSSHASTMFTVAIFFSLIFKSYIKHISLILIIWASLIAYSRIYLGVHYPGDVLAGILLGCLIGFSGYRLYLFIDKRYLHHKNAYGFK